MLHVLASQNSIVNHFIAELRHAVIQQDRMRFRKNLERIGEVFAYEISKTLEYEPTEIETPLGIAETAMLANHPVLATINRAGIAMHNAMLNYFDQSDSIIKEQ